MEEPEPLLRFIFIKCAGPRRLLSLENGFTAPTPLGVCQGGRRRSILGAPGECG